MLYIILQKYVAIVLILNVFMHKQAHNHMSRNAVRAYAYHSNTYSMGIPGRFFPVRSDKNDFTETTLGADIKSLVKNS